MREKVIFNAMVKKLDKLDPKLVAILFTLISFASFFSGLGQPFQGDDTYQIVQNVPVHSIGNLFSYFDNSTFYNGQKLTGVYYRPMMTTVYSIIYLFFGAHPLMYHIVQLSFYTSGAFLLYLIFKYFFNPGIALGLALIFLVHPLNSQVVYSIPTMQDALFFFFGTMALWLLIKNTNIHTRSSKVSSESITKNTRLVALFLLLAMLSKESGIVFTAIAGLYLFWFGRSRLREYIITMVIPIILYLLLKINAVGINTAQHAAPIDSVTMLGRLFTVPSIVLFYITKFFFPWKLATGYYWVHSTFSTSQVLLPLLIDLAVIGVFLYFGFRIAHKLKKSQFHAYLFFTFWTVIGLAPYLQIIKLDMTVSETWFYFSMAGLLGMIALALQSLRLKLQAIYILVPIVIIVSSLGVRSAFRGKDYSSQYNLAQHDLTVSKDNYSALSNISQHLIDTKQYTEAAVYARRSIGIYPVVSNYINLGVSLEQTNDYQGAISAYTEALKYGNLSIIYENIGLILVVYSNPAVANQFLLKAVKEYPNDYKLWVYLAVLYGATGSNANAKTAIQTAKKYGSVPDSIVTNIMTGQPFTLSLLGKDVLIQ